MFSGGDYADVGRWLRNFVVSHAKRESPRLEARVEAEGPREGRSYGVRLVLGERVRPAPDAAPMELSFPDVRDDRGSMAWCQALAGRVRELARGLLAAEAGERRSA